MILPICTAIDTPQPLMPSGTMKLIRSQEAAPEGIGYVGSSPVQQAPRPIGAACTCWLPTQTITFTGGIPEAPVCVSSPAMAPSPVPAMVTVCPGIAGLDGLTSEVVPSPAVVKATACPYPPGTMVAIPKAAGTTVMLDWAESAPFVTVIVPAPTGVFEGRIASISLAETYIMIALTVEEPTATVILTPFKPPVVGKGKVACVGGSCPTPAPLTVNAAPCAIPYPGNPVGMRLAALVTLEIVKAADAGPARIIPAITRVSIGRFGLGEYIGFPEDAALNIIMRRCPKNLRKPA